MEGTEECQDELTTEDGSVGNGTIDADGAQSHRAERASDAQDAQLVGDKGSMDLEGIVEAAAARHNGAASPGKPHNWGTMTKAQKRYWRRKGAVKE